MSDLLASAGVLTTLALLFLIARVARTRFGLQAERSRKCVHVAMGLVALTFPWIFSGSSPVVALAIAAGGTMLVMRLNPRLRAAFGCVIHDVERRSYGEFAFIAGVAGAFALAHGNPLAYVVAISILAFADAIAGLVGSTLAVHRYRVFDGWKSLEGSLAFFAVAFACLCLLLHAHTLEGMSIAALCASALTAIESITPAGFDNASIPLAGVLLVQTLRGVIV